MFHYPTVPASGLAWTLPSARGVNKLYEIARNALELLRKQSQKSSGWRISELTRCFTSIPLTNRCGGDRQQACTKTRGPFWTLSTKRIGKGCLPTSKSGNPGN